MRDTNTRICNCCGRTLEIGERCNCAQPVAGFPRDGLRSRCPHFISRSSYRQQSYILCGEYLADHRTAFHSGDERNTHYRRYCCGLPTACRIYQEIAAKGDD